jgi:hypothetical protein
MERDDDGVQVDESGGPTSGGRPAGEVLREVADGKGREPLQQKLLQKEERARKWAAAVAAGWPNSYGAMKVLGFDPAGLCYAPKALSLLKPRLKEGTVRGAKSGDRRYDPQALAELVRTGEAARALAAARRSHDEEQMRERETEDLLERRYAALTALGYSESGPIRDMREHLVPAVVAAKLLKVQRRLLATIRNLRPATAYEDYADERPPTLYDPIDLLAARDSPEVRAARADEEESRRSPELFAQRSAALDQLGCAGDSHARRHPRCLASTKVAADLLGVPAAWLRGRTWIQPTSKYPSRRGRGEELYYDPRVLIAVHDYPEVVGARGRTARAGRRGSTASSPTDPVVPVDDEDVEVPER